MTHSHKYTENLCCMTLILMSVLSLMGCSVTEPRRSGGRAYMLDVERSDRQYQCALAGRMRTRPCHVARPYSGRGLVYRLTDVEYEQDGGRHFLVPLDDQLTALMRCWFQCPMTGDSAPHTAPTPYILDAYLTALMADFTVDPPMVRASMVFSLERRVSGRGQTVFEKGYQHAIPVEPRPHAHQVVSTMSDCIEHILIDLEKDLSDPNLVQMDGK